MMLFLKRYTNHWYRIMEASYSEQQIPRLEDSKIRQLKNLESWNIWILGSKLGVFDE